MFELQFEMLPKEYWYGFCVSHGTKFPLSAKSDYSMDLTVNTTGNQIVPLLLSNQGRYVWSEGSLKLTAKAGTIQLEGAEEIHLYSGFESLRGAYMAAVQAHFPAVGKQPPEVFFQVPQYNTWIELGYDQNQEAVLRYAHAILDAGLPAGILMIDDGWNTDYGCWEFHPSRFPAPKEMMAQLHEMGFLVMLWTCPFVSADSPKFRQLEKEGGLVRNPNGEPAVRKWWNGYSAVLDLTNPVDTDWYHAQLRKLHQEYEVDGFKFDAGDGYFYRWDDVTHLPVTPNGQTELWGKLGAEYPYNEYRSCFKCGCQPLVQRLEDKNHSWGADGIASLIPNELAQGILGYPFTCPDMIGGGNIGSFWDPNFRMDEELFVRYAQTAALMPMMQFSAAPWRVLSPDNATLCIEAAKKHCAFAPLLLELAQIAAQTGEPIVRYMEYEFPGQGMEEIKDQFLLGSNLLVAPVLESGKREREVLLPEGKWKYVDETIYEGGRVTVSAPLDCLPYFERC